MLQSELIKTALNSSMITTFRAFMEADDETPAAAWARMRAQTQGLGDSQPVATYKPGQAPPATGMTTAGAKQPTGLPPAVVDLLQQGFKDGGLVGDSLIRMFRLHPDHSLVGPDMITATARGPYPFVKEKRAGVPTGRIRFVQHFPIAKFLQIVSEK